MKKESYKPFFHMRNKNNVYYKISQENLINFNDFRKVFVPNQIFVKFSTHLFMCTHQRVLWAFNLCSPHIHINLSWINDSQPTSSGECFGCGKRNIELWTRHGLCDVVYFHTAYSVWIFHATFANKTRILRRFISLTYYTFVRSKFKIYSTTKQRWNK